MERGMPRIDQDRSIGIIFVEKGLIDTGHEIGDHHMFLVVSHLELGHVEAFGMVVEETSLAVCRLPRQEIQVDRLPLLPSSTASPGRSCSSVVTRRRQCFHHCDRSLLLGRCRHFFSLKSIIQSQIELPVSFCFR
jgi:hypothetical protein